MWSSLGFSIILYKAVTSGQPLLPKVTGCRRRWCWCKVRFCPCSMFRSSYALDRTWEAHTNLRRRGPRLEDEAVAAAGAGATTPLSAAEPQLGMILCGSSVVRGGEVAAHCWPRQGWIGRVKSRATHGHTTTLSHTRRHCATYQATLGR